MSVVRRVEPGMRVCEEAVGSMNELKISIVTVVLNRRDYLRQAIKNVLSQDYSHFEHIVVDGASTDGTIDVIKEHPHLRWISEPDDGAVFAMNKGLAMVEGDIFGWLNSDESYLPGTLHKINRYFHDHPDWDMICGTYEFVAEDGRVVGRSNHHTFDLHKQIIGFNWIAPSAMFLRRRALDAVGRRVDPTLRDAFDHDLWIRVGHKHCVKSVADCLSRFGLHRGSGVVSFPQRSSRERKIIRRRYGGEERLVDRLWWVPYLEVRLVLHRYLKWRHMLHRAGIERSE